MATSSSELPPEVASQNKGPAIIASTVTLTALATIFVAGRTYVRSRILRHLGLDDYLILLSMIFGYVNLGLSSAAVANGNGRHFQLLTTEQQENTIMFTIAGFCPGIFSFAVPKLAVVSLLTKVMNPSKLHRIWLWFMTSMCALILFGCVIILYAQCTPSRSQWDFSITDKTCWSPWVLVDYAIFAGSFSATVDLYLAVYPTIVLFKLQMSIKKKLALSSALGLGSVATVVAIYKTTRIPGLASPDFSYDTSDLVIWTSMEGNSIIIAACIPTLQPLLELILGRKALGSSSGGRGKSGGQYYNRYGSRGGHGGNRSAATPTMELSDVGAASAATTSKSKRSRTDAVEVDSQESILPADAAKRETVVGSGSGSHHHLGAIQRTDDVVVCYEEHSVGDVEKGSGWSRIG
ncbi:hypothetical protein BDY21DRAFT_388291 [Lineolata rhizophorae]|uniref:Rhodopsin domain-containing protein n=1 Tax=Lineolata rhizophorae TaxID=578093 RepID=A0A6A6NN33_9PEZI|nr:hypothetical protein BDY21DRAFT_388291 [Lineolata rhizophorae]